MADTKYGYLEKNFNSRESPFGSFAWPKGGDLAGLNLNFTWAYTSMVGE